MGRGGVILWLLIGWVVASVATAIALSRWFRFLRGDDDDNDAKLRD
jgi:hypothetical protein